MEFEDIFLYGERKLRVTDLVQHVIEVETEKPISKAPYRAPPAYRVKIDAIIDELLDQGIIEKSKSAWASPLFLVSKKREEGKPPEFRPVIDYRALNKVTKHQNFPLPLISDLLESVSNSTIFSSLDCFSGFYQVPLHPDSKDLTTFVTHRGAYRFTRLPFGLRNAPIAFQRLIEKVFGDIRENILYYIDDIFRHDTDEQTHLEGLRQIFERLRAAKLTLKPSKCKFFLDEIDFLGHRIGKGEIAPQQTKLDAIENYPRPTTLRQVQRFLGFVNYYRNFIPKCSELATPLTDLTKKGTPFNWTSTTQDAFDRLRKALTCYPVLRIPDFNEEFILEVDASCTAIGAVLSQKFPDGEHPVAYASKKLNKAQQSYSAVQLENFGAYFMIKKHRFYLLPRHFTLRTDHSALKYLLTTASPPPMLARWLAELSEYSFTVEHRPGKSIPHVDALSRAPPVNVIAHVPDQLPVPWDKLRILEEQQNCAELQNWHHLARTDTENYFYDEFGLLCKYLFSAHGKTPVLCAPRAMVPYVLEMCHNNILAGHTGILKTAQLIRKSFDWPRLFADVRNHVTHCLTCLMRKARKPNIEIQDVEEPVRPMQILALDLMGPINPPSAQGNRYILTAQCEFTRWTEAIAIPDKKTETVARALVEQVFCRYGIPESLKSDRGTEFTSSLLEKITKLLKVNHILCSAGNPGANGRLERFHKTFANIMACAIEESQSDWESQIPYALFVFRNSVHAATKETPAYLMFGRQFRMPWAEILEPSLPCMAEEVPYHEVLKRRLQIAHAHAAECNAQKIAEDHQQKNCQRSLPTINIGQRVLLRRRYLPVGQVRKLATKWTGPFRVTKVRSPVTFDLVEEATGRKIDAHHSNILPIPDSFYDPQPDIFLQTENGQRRRAVTNTTEDLGTPGQTSDRQQPDITAPVRTPYFLRSRIPRLNSNATGDTPTGSSRATPDQPTEDARTQSSGQPKRSAIRLPSISSPSSIPLGPVTRSAALKAANAASRRKKSSNN